MITKIRSFQDSVWAKGILALTALSFMSLFGISGYLSRNNSNQPIVKVDGTTIYRDEINAQLNQQLQMAKAFLGDSAEISDEIKNAMLMDIVQKNVTNAIIQTAAQDLNVSISDELVRKIIYSRPEFMDANGQFSMDRMRQMLSATGWNEKTYIETLRRDVIKQHLVATPVDGLALPKVMNDYIAKLDGQRKVFQYVVIKPSEMKIDRKISNDELEQYYQDFAAQFETPETRDISFVELSADSFAQSYAPNDAEIKAYYDENINEYVVPETRNVLQMVFDSQDAADKARAALDTGADFYLVAKNNANQDKASTELGNVSADMLIADMSEAVFEAKKGDIVGPIKSDLGWHIMKVAGITPKKETTLASVKAKIIETIRKEKAYDQANEKIAEIEDKLGAGADLAEIAAQYKTPMRQIIGLSEDSSAAQVSPQDKNLIKSADFIDLVFSYNTGETTQVLETENGFVIAKIDATHEAHLKDIKEVRQDIEKLWQSNEKTAIAQELSNDITRDLENGETLADTASRFDVSMQTSAPLKKGQSIANLPAIKMTELFQEQVGTPKLISSGENTIIAVPTKIINAEKKLSEKEMEALRQEYASEMAQTIADELIQAYGANYDVRVKYRNLGIEDTL